MRLVMLSFWESKWEGFSRKWGCLAKKADTAVLVTATRVGKVQFVGWWDRLIREPWCRFVKSNSPESKIRRSVCSSWLTVLWLTVSPSCQMAFSEMPSKKRLSSVTILTVWENGLTVSKRDQRRESFSLHRSATFWRVPRWVSGRISRNLFKNRGASGASFELSSSEKIRVECFLPSCFKILGKSGFQVGWRV